MTTARFLPLSRVRSRALIGGLLLVAGLTAEASAQFYARPYFGGGFYRGEIIIPPLPRREVGLHPSEIFLDLEDRGYKPLAIASRRPGVLVIDAVSSRNEPVRLVVDAFDGEILQRFSRRPEVARRPDGLGPGSTPGLMPEPRRRETPRDNSKADEEDRVAEIPLPPRRPAERLGAPTTAPTPAPQGNGRPAPVAPARDPSLWAPKT
jgi:hypothetical protein